MPTRSLQLLLISVSMLCRSRLHSRKANRTMHPFLRSETTASAQSARLCIAARRSCKFRMHSIGRLGRTPVLLRTSADRRMQQTPPTAACRTMQAAFLPAPPVAPCRAARRRLRDAPPARAPAERLTQRARGARMCSGGSGGEPGEERPDIPSGAWREVRAALHAGSVAKFEDQKKGAYRTGHWAHPVRTPSCIPLCIFLRTLTTASSDRYQSPKPAATSPPTPPSSGATPPTSPSPSSS